MSVRPVLALLLAAGCAAPPEAPPPPEEWDRELPDVHQIEDFAFEDESVEAGQCSFVPVRVVDDATGAPVAGARIDNWWEADTPHAEPWEELLEGTWTTDRDGMALLPSRDHASWYYVEAPGYAPFGEMSLEEEFRLVRGIDSRLEIRDWRDRPVPGAVVEFMLGCGHTPNVRRETADAEGRLVLRCVDENRGSLWIRADGVAGRNEAYSWGWEFLPVERGARVLRGDPSPVIEGRVLRPDGSPAAGARVGTREAHRGPWTLADSGGRFRLAGAPPWGGLVAMAPRSDPVPEGFDPPQVEFDSAPGVFTTVRLPAEGTKWRTPEEREADREKSRAESEAYQRGEEPEPIVPAEGPGIRVRVAAAPGVLAFGRVRVVLIREGPGTVERTAPLFRDGVAARALALAPGTWTVTAGDPAGLLRPESRKVEVKEGWVEVSFTLGTNPAWSPRVEGAGNPPNGTFFLTTEHGEVEATPCMTAEVSSTGAIHVPASGPFAVEFRAADGRRARVLLDAPPAGEGPILRLPPPVPEEPWVDENARPRELPPARLAVLLPDGSPADGAEVNAVAADSARGPNAGVRRADQRYLRLDEQGALEVGFDRGDRLFVVAGGEGADSILPFEATIDGPGPWTLRWPTGEVAVRAVDEAGSPLEEFAVVRGDQWRDEIDAVDGVVRLRGASRGPLRLWVAAPGRRMHDLRLVLAEGEKREVVVRMNRAKPE